MGKLWRRRFRRTTLWLFLCIGTLAGLAAARAGLSFSSVWIGILILSAAVVWPWRRWPALLAVLLVGVMCGGARGSACLRDLAKYQPLERQPVVLQVKALNDALYNDRRQLAFDAGDVTLADGQPLPGKIQVSGFGANAVFQGDILAVTGKLYPGYGAYQGRVSYADISVLQRHPSLTGAIRQKFTAGMQTALPEPLAPFAMGLLVGQRATLPDSVKQDLLMVGLTHIIAVSGYNLTIILQASRRLLAKRSKRIATGLAMGLIGTFLLLTGGSASIVRAAIVSMLSIVAGYYGRTFKPLTLIALAAAITAWANPVYIWSDLSWYLSFLAFYGVMILSPLVQARWPARWQRTLVGGVALESICAEVMSLPFVLYIFGQMSFVGLPANMLVVVLVPLAMLLGLIAGLAGMLAAPLSGWFAWPAAILLNYMLDTAHVLAGLPYIFVKDRKLPLAATLGLYGLILLFCGLLRHKTKRWAPFGRKPPEVV